MFNLEVKLDHTQFSYRKLLKILSDPSRKLPVSLESDSLWTVVFHCAQPWAHTGECARLKCLLDPTFQAQTKPGLNISSKKQVKLTQASKLPLRLHINKYKSPQIEITSFEWMLRTRRIDIYNQQLLHFGHISAVRGWCLSQSWRRTCRSWPMHAMQKRDHCH